MIRIRNSWGFIAMAEESRKPWNVDRVVSALVDGSVGSQTPTSSTQVLLSADEGSTVTPCNEENCKGRVGVEAVFLRALRCLLQSDAGTISEVR